MILTEKNNDTSLVLKRKRFDKMSVFSSRIKVIFITNLALLYSETAFAPSGDMCEMPDCNVYVDQLHFCTREMDPICTTHGRICSNKCIFRSDRLGDSGNFEFNHHDSCWPLPWLHIPAVLSQFYFAMDSTTN